MADDGSQTSTVESFISTHFTKIVIGFSFLIVAAVAIIVVGFTSCWKFSYKPTCTDRNLNIITIGLSDVSVSTNPTPGLCNTTAYTKYGNDWVKDDSATNQKCYSLGTNDDGLQPMWTCPIGSFYWVDDTYVYGDNPIGGEFCVSSIIDCSTIKCSESCSDFSNAKCKNVDE